MSRKANEWQSWNPVPEWFLTEREPALLDRADTQLAYLPNFAFHRNRLELYVIMQSWGDTPQARQNSAELVEIIPKQDNPGLRMCLEIGSLPVEVAEKIYHQALHQVILTPPDIRVD